MIPPVLIVEHKFGRESSTSTASVDGERDALIRSRAGTGDLTTSRRSRLRTWSNLRVSSSTDSNKLSIARKRSSTHSGDRNRLNVAQSPSRRHSWVEGRVTPEDGMPTMGEYFKERMEWQGMSIGSGAATDRLYLPEGGSNCVSQQDLNNEIVNSGFPSPLSYLIPREMAVEERLNVWTTAAPTGKSPMEDFSDLEDDERRPINGESSGLIYSNQNLLAAGYDVTPLESRKTSAQSLYVSGVEAARSLSNVLFSDAPATFCFGLNSPDQSPYAKPQEIECTIWMGAFQSRNGDNPMFLENLEFEFRKSSEDSEDLQDAAEKEELQRRARMQYGVDSSFKTRLQQYFVENYKSSFRIRSFNLFIKVLSCVLYCIRVVQDDADLTRGGRKSDGATSNITYESLLWITSDPNIWLLQTIVAIISMAQTILLFYISYKGSFIRLLLNVHFLLEMITSFPFIVSIFFPELRNLYVPVFLNCWLAKSALQAMLNDLNRSMTMVSSALSRQMMSLMSILICLVFTGMCSMEHLMRGGDRPIDLWTSFYFVMVTLSTVGYGDVCPNTWHSQLVIVIIICIVLAVMPSQVEALIQTVMEKQQAGDDLGTFGHSEAHVVVTITHLEVEFIRDFLTEFYAHQENQHILTVLLSPSEMDSQTKMLLRVPLWSQRVFYVRGTALVDEDLERARMSKALRCFILSARHVKKKNESDQHTILRSWAVKDFAPHVPQYVQVFRPETKMHLEHAEEVICEDEFKYGLLANNCICPGLSTFLTLLIHTSRGEEGQKSSESWHKVYGFHSGNEIYDILVEDSKFFGDYLGNTFTYASFHAHRAYGVGLLAIKGSQPGARIKLNPGLTHIIQPGDRLYYMALTNEESLYNFKRDLKRQQIKAATTSNIANAGLELDYDPKSTIPIPKGYLDVPDLEGGLEKPEKKRSRNIFVKLKSKSSNKSGNGAESLLLDAAMGGEETARRPSIAAVTEMSHYSSSSEDEDDVCDRCGGECIESLVHRTTPPVKAYIGTSFTVCHMLKKKRDLCCLQLDQPCSHNPSPIATQATWKNPAVILAATRTSSGMYNFIIPLRAYYRPVHELRPIVLLLELEDIAGPANAFLDAISYFPLVYWIQGKISSIDNLLRAGICRAEQVIVVKETAAIAEEHSADCDTIVTVQKIHRMFPRVRLITELTHSSNMRFVQFDPFNPLQQSKFEKKERKRGSNMPFMFRLPFAQGGVFSANMMDRILYQASQCLVIVKEFVVDFVRLLLGIDQTPGSGYLTSFEITGADLWIKTYGRLYQQLCSKCADVPIGIFRTKKMDAKTASLDTADTCHLVNSNFVQGRRKDVEDMVKHRMDLMGLKSEENEVVCVARTETTISYVIINPTTDMQLEEGDIVYVIRAPVKQDVGSRKVNPRRGLRRSEAVRDSSQPPLSSMD